jgi:hypothetical protein
MDHLEILVISTTVVFIVNGIYLIVIISHYIDLEAGAVWF